MIERPLPPSAPKTIPLRLVRTVVLVGLMGAGKTSVGKRLASLLGAPFIDSDTEIAEAAGMSIPEIFASFGEQAFRDGERRVMMRLLGDGPKIVATGGGGFVEPRTRAEIRLRATSVWIRAEPDLLWERVRDRPGRPLLQVPDPRAALEDLHRRRAQIYAEADITVDSRRDATPLTMAHEILAAVQTQGRALAERHAIEE